MKMQFVSFTEAAGDGFGEQLPNHETVSVKKLSPFLVLLTTFCCRILAATYYVAEEGSNANPGTQSHPWRTIQHAADRVTSGDLVIVMPGTYDERVILPRGISGTPEAWITFRSSLPRQAFIKGFQGNRNNYLRLEGFAITYEKGSWLGGGIWLHGSHWEIRSNFFYDVQGSAVQANWQTDAGNDDVRISGNKMYRCNKGVVIYGNRWIVEGNDMERLVYYSEDADYVRFFGRNHIIRKNRLWGTRQEEIGPAHTDGFQTFSVNGEIAQDILIEANVLEDYFGQHFIIHGDRGSHSNIFILNNICWSKGTASWGVLVQGDPRNVRIFNNTFVDIGYHGIGVKRSEGEPATVVVRNNILANVGNPYFTEGPLDTANNLIYNQVKMFDPGRYPDDIVNQNPLFISWAGNFQLQPNSPAINVGAVVNEVNSDFLGVPRPVNGKWDIGAFEMVNPRLAAPLNLKAIK